MKMKVVVKEVQRFQEHNFFMKVVPEGEFRFKAGQFAMVKLGGVEKPFSIASFPGEETIDFLVSVHPEGEITPKLEAMKVGDKFEIDGPYGTFVISDTDAKEIVFIAAGTGIAPFRAMVTDALYKFPDKTIRLLFGFRCDYYFEDFWNKLQEVHKNFKVRATCSKPTPEWGGLTGRVTEHVGNVVQDAKGKEVYLCGPPAMVKDTKKALKDLGFDDEQIHVEKW
jgi:NAD(P)H-flavin reductase